MQDFVSNSLAQKLWISSSGVDGVPVGSGATLRKAVGIKHHLEIWSNEVAVNALANGTQMTRGPL
jgi:hypothetical protein